MQDASEAPGPSRNVKFPDNAKLNGRIVNPTPVYGD
jgi:hypothetical protein